MTPKDRACLFALALLLSGCAVIERARVWHEPCRRWCAMEMDVPMYARAELAAHRAKDDMCLCVNGLPTARITRGQDEETNIQDGGPWLRTQMPKAMLPLLEDDSEEAALLRENLVRIRRECARAAGKRSGR